MIMAPSLPSFPHVQVGHDHIDRHDDPRHAFICSNRNGARAWLLDESDAFVVEPARATSLYHLIGAVARHWAGQYFPE
jgi:hypothetical protein